MTWTVPTLKDLRKQVRDYIVARVPGADANIPNSPLRVISDNQAGFASLALDFIRWISKQMLPDTAESEWLQRHGDIWLGGRKAGTYAEGFASFTGTEGVVIPSGTEMTYGTIPYQVTADITIGPSATDGPVRALISGVGGNRDAGDTMALTIAVSGVDIGATVVSMSGGVDAETDDDLRGRILARIQKPPMGGDADDYVAWAKEVPGVTRAWCAPNEMGIGTVTIRFMMDTLRASDFPLTNGFPNDDDVSAVQVHLDTMRPVAVKDFFVVAPIPEPINFTLSNLNADDGSTIAAIGKNVQAMLRDRASPAFSQNGIMQDAAVIYSAWVSESVLSTIGVEHFDLTMTDHAMPSNGHIAVLGSISYV